MNSKKTDVYRKSPITIKKKGFPNELGNKTKSYLAIPNLYSPPEPIRYSKLFVTADGAGLYVKGKKCSRTHSLQQGIRYIKGLDIKVDCTPYFPSRNAWNVVYTGNNT